MKKFYLYTAVISLTWVFLLLFGGNAWGQTAFTAYIDNIGATTCPASNTNFGDDLFVNLPAGVSFSGFTRNVVGCNAATSHYRTSNYNSSSKANTISENRYVTWTLTANASVTFTLSQTAIRHERSNQGGDKGAIYYSINGAAFTQVGGDFNIGTSNGRNVLNFASPVTIPASGNIEFRFYAWTSGGPTGNGNVRIKGGDNYASGSGVVGTFTPTATPAVDVTSDFSTFFYALNEGPSEEQSYSVSGNNLTTNIVLSVPSNFEHALNAAGPYQTTPISLAPVSGTVNATDIFVRMVAGLGGGSYGGDITVSSDDPSSPAEVAIAGEVLSETLPYFEDFGTTAGVFPLGWTTSGPGAANWTIGTSTGSPGSGGANLQDDGSVVGQEAIVTVNRAISTVGADEVLVSFLARRTGAYSGNVELDYSTDGSTWNNVPFADVANNATWAPVVVSLPSAAANVPNLRLRLRTTRTNTSGNYRIDDFRVLEPTKFFYQSGALHQTSSWQDASSSNPSNFTDDNQIFILEGASNYSTSATWTVSGDNSRIIVGDGSNTTSLTITNGNPINGTMQVKNNAILTINTINIPTLSGLEEESTIVYNSGVASNIAGVAYGNLTISGAGVKTFPNSTIAVSGNLLFDNASINFAGNDSRIDYDRNITINGSINYGAGGRLELRATANSNNQVINTNGAELQCYDFQAQLKTGGSLTFAANTNIVAANNLRLNFPTGVTFNDGGNTIEYGDDLRLEGDPDSYNLTGTIRLNAVSGTNDITHYDDIPLNNFEVISGGGATTNLPNFNLIINGNLLLDGEMNFGGSNSALDLGGNVTLQNTVEYGGIWRPNIQFIGNNAQVINTGANTFEAFNFYAENKTGGSLTLAAGNANILALNNLRFDFPAGITFNDGGNTIVYSDDLRIQGDADSYTFTGTLRLIGQNTGDHDFDFVDAPLNNLEIILNDGGDGRARMNRGTASNIIINGDFTYNVAGSYANMPMGSTTLTIGGNFTDNSASDKINEQSSTWIFNGTANQTFATPNFTHTFNNVTVNKTSNRLIFNNSVNIDNELRLTNGLVETDGVAKIILSAGASLIGENATNYITGTIETERVVAADENNTFGGIGIEIESEVAMGATTVTRVTGSRLAGGGGNQSLLRYFQIDPTTNGTEADPLNANVIFRFLPHELELNEDTTSELEDLALFKRDIGAGVDDWEKLQDADVQSGFIAVSNLDRFSEIALADNENSPLPIDLIHFGATALSQDKVLVNWSTATETNNHYFRVERSNNARNFELVQEVQGAGFSQNTLNYNITDEPNFGSTQLFYQLVQVDFDGTETIYGPVVVNLESLNTLNIFAAKGQIILQYSGLESSALQFNIVDMQGRLVQRQMQVLEAGVQPLQHKPLTKGIYVVNAFNAKQQFSFKISVE
jgi:hypothetical protein